MSSTRKITLKSSDGEAFNVDEAVALESQTIKHMIEDDCADSGIPLPNITSKILAKVIEYCKKHVEAVASDEKPTEDELKAWDAKFVMVDQATLFDLILGCDASVLLNSKGNNKAEKDGPPNVSLHAFYVIDEAKKAVEAKCPGVVSCADILALAARDSVFQSGGPRWDVPKGRKDGRTSKASETRKLPAPTFNLSQLQQSFSQRGLSMDDLVALSGGGLQHAFIGIGFLVKTEAYDFQAALHDHMKCLNKKKTAEEMEQHYQQSSSVDYSLK